ncbi:hypothetical protein ACFPZ0_23010 [Streptomonospora nanhaiensis]|uniref:Uncharacterized protein n=1 Tax=Streptomonospora nanhaiensis TaxID=1323731 RepID=A0A853BG79_9ACTN|nr:hypothetical protein [Streptomonospora nanhaiensis]MBV2365063.1 hypothetical protein [Streptomonospora nanhaiensis]MBX9388268.1 hypothetical protein [Streptomonospora nanhaiensis]NYI94478.1 hypothetical protein [Streptomonospora nanhaiensis]
MTSDRGTGPRNGPDEETRHAPADDDRPLADRRAGQGAEPAPDTEIAAEREPSPSDPPVQDGAREGDEPPEPPTRV